MKTLAPLKPVLVLAFAAGLLGITGPLSAAETKIIHNVTVIDGTGATPRASVDVWIADGRVAAITPECEHGDGVEIIDATGRYLIPGFIDMHVHLLEHGRDEKGDIPPRVDWDIVRRYLRLLIEHGVTTVRDPGSETEAAVTLRRMLSEGSVTGPRLLTAGRIINASSFNPEPFKPVRTAEDVRREIRWQKAAGVDFIKIYSSMPPDLTNVAIEEARKQGLPVIGHLYRTTWKEAAAMGIEFIAHGAPWTRELLPEPHRDDYPQTMFGRVFWLEHLDPASPEVRDTVDAIVEAGAVLDPTLIAYHTKFFGNDPRWLENPDNALLPATLITGWRAGSFTRDWTDEQYAAARKAWPRMLAWTKLLFDRGVRLTVGTDAPTAWIVPGPSFHDELVLLSDAGIPTAAILRMATFDAARALGREDEFGSVTPGLRADLVLLAKNPLDDIRNTRSIVTVFQSGVAVATRDDRENQPSDGANVWPEPGRSDNWR